VFFFLKIKLSKTKVFLISSAHTMKDFVIILTTLLLLDNIYVIKCNVIKKLNQYRDNLENRKRILGKVEDFLN